MKEDKKHALLSASGSQRWINCTPSLRLEEQIEDSKESTSALEGTDAHALAEQKLSSLIKDSKYDVRDKLSYYDEKMEEYTNDYMSYVLENFNAMKEKDENTKMYIEQKIDFSNFVPDGFGTADCILVSNDEIHVIDFKYGIGVLVDANNNTQMKLYALGALNLIEDSTQIKNIKMTIFQPRICNVSSYELQKDELLKWANTELKQKAELAYKGDGNLETGSWCRFCKARPKCRKQAEENMRLAKYEFKNVNLLSDSEIEDILKQITSLKKWADDVLEYATTKAIKDGKSWKGFKIVEGRSIRKYKNDEDVARALRDEGITDIYQKKLYTITEMEKRIGKDKFDEILKDLIYKTKGKLILVPEDDRRAGIEISKVKKEFNKIKGD